MNTSLHGHTSSPSCSTVRWDRTWRISRLSLHQQRYAPSSIQSYLRAGHTFGRWLRRQGYALSDIDASVFQRYIAGLKRYRSGHLPKAAEGLNHLFRLLQHHGVVRQRHTMGPPAPLDQWLAEYDAYLERVVGLAVGTRQGALPLARRFITSCFGTAAPDWPSLTAPMITAFVCQEAARRQGAGRKRPAVVVRSFLRFLVFRGEIRAGLEAAAPTPPQWTHATLPTRLTPQEVERLLAIYDDGTPSGLRNRAMLLLLARLGLRAHEVYLSMLGRYRLGRRSGGYSSGEDPPRAQLTLASGCGLCRRGLRAKWAASESPPPNLPAMSSAISAIDPPGGLVDGAAGIPARWPSPMSPHGEPSLPSYCGVSHAQPRRELQRGGRCLGAPLLTDHGDLRQIGP